MSAFTALWLSPRLVGWMTAVAIVTFFQVRAADSDVLARAGTIDLKAGDLRTTLESLDPNARNTLAHDPALMSQMVRSLLVQRLVLQKAQEQEWERRPEVAKQLESIRQNAIIESYLDSVSQPPATYPSDAEISSAYEANKPMLLVPRQYRLAQIFIASPSGANRKNTELAQLRLETVRASLRTRDADFSEIAKATSDEKTSASKGGEIGWLTEMLVQPEIRPQVLGLAKGAVSEPIHLGDGWHILKALDIKDSYTPLLDEVRNQIVSQLRAERVKAARQTYIDDLLRDTPMAVNELAISNASPNAARPAGAPVPELVTRPARPAFK